MVCAAVAVACLGAAQPAGNRSSPPPSRSPTFLPMWRPPPVPDIPTSCEDAPGGNPCGADQTCSVTAVPYQSCGQSHSPPCTYCICPGDEHVPANRSRSAAAGPATCASDVRGGGRHCIGWKQTGACRSDVYEPQNNQNCGYAIAAGVSGHCLCADGSRIFFPCYRAEKAVNCSHHCSPCRTKECVPPTPCHTATCDDDTGECVSVAANEGSPCGSNGETCAGGVCAAVRCGDTECRPTQQCQRSYCEGADCSRAPAVDGTTCVGESGKTLPCLTGECVECSSVKSANVCGLLALCSWRNGSCTDAQCTWTEPAEGSFLECGDGTRHDISNAAVNGSLWEVCSGRGGRARCPSESPAGGGPIMCAYSRDCSSGTDHCCEESCSEHGGPRPCPDLTPTGGTEHGGEGDSGASRSTLAVVAVVCVVGTALVAGVAAAVLTRRSRLLAQRAAEMYAATAEATREDEMQSPVGDGEFDAVPI
eukprot:TRINITY_DN20385_c0_g1_i1.p1 TRINITY_DN20385_c0_g1~~TRINITY_DN20385_c0_g1_i1.p1  ORF type:complete len:478 (+),score=97.22 TRINITY_DN20385_c0_g1_i1:61-1494(+)